VNTKNTPLKDLEVLLFDCQATHSDPARGEVFEIGWLQSRASNPPPGQLSAGSIQTHLIKLPPSKSLPGHIRKITGLQTEDFQGAASLKQIWSGLSRSAKRTAAENKMSLCPTVIHFSRYEEPFLRSCDQTYSPESELLNPA
jgi:hypothetical protein